MVEPSICWLAPVRVTVPELCVNAPAPDTSQFPATVNEVSSAAAGAESAPLVTVAFPFISRSQEALSASNVPPFIKRLPVTAKSKAAKSNVPFVKVRLLVTVILLVVSVHPPPVPLNTTL